MYGTYFLVNSEFNAERKSNYIKVEFGAFILRKYNIFFRKRK